MKTFSRGSLLLMALACLMSGGVTAATADVTEGKDYVRSKASARLAPGKPGAK